MLPAGRRRLIGSFPAGTKPVAVTVDGTSTFVYSANQGSNDVSAFKAASGALTQVAGSPYPVEPNGSVGTPQPIFLTVDHIQHVSLYREFRIFQHLRIWH